MRSTASLSTKLIRIGAALLVLALASISLTLWVTRQLEGGAAAVNEAGRMRMQAWRLTSAVQAQRPPAELQALVQQFDQGLSLLREGDAKTMIFDEIDRGVGGATAAAVGRRLETIEGLGDQHPVVRAWQAEQVPQCGFCQSGQMMATVALLRATPRPDAAGIAAALDGHLCRCGTQQRIRRAVARAAEAGGA